QFRVWPRRDLSDRGRADFGGDGPLLRLPRRHAAVEDRSAVTQSKIIKREIDAGRRRHPILAEVNNDARVVRDAKLFECRFQLIYWRQFENQSLATRCGYIR